MDARDRKDRWRELSPGWEGVPRPGFPAGPGTGALEGAGHPLSSGAKRSLSCFPSVAIPCLELLVENLSDLIHKVEHIHV